MEKLQKTLKNTRKRKRERSGSEAGAKRERSGRQENHGKPWKNVEIIESASFPLRSRFVPAPFPLQARGVLTLPWSFQCLGAKGCCHGKITRKHASCIKVNLRTKKFTKLLPPKNHHETLGVLTLPWSFQVLSSLACLIFWLPFFEGRARPVCAATTDPWLTVIVEEYLD